MASSDEKIRATRSATFPGGCVEAELEAEAVEVIEKKEVPDEIRSALETLALPYINGFFIDE